MKETLESIREGLRRNSFVNEASVSQGIVLRLLRELGWDTFDVDHVSPEYSVKGRRVDYALCHPPRQPRIFIEVKQVSKSALDFEEQLAAYAYEEGVPLVVLTTGKEWNFYVPYGPGKFVDRRVYRIDLLERLPDEILERLRRYLAFDTVRTGAFTVNAQEDLRDVLSVQETKRQLPAAWARLLGEPSPQLTELLMQQLESITGERPQARVVQEFIRSKVHIEEPASASTPDGPSAWPTPPIPPRRGPRVPEENFVPSGNIPLDFMGQHLVFSTHRARLVRVFELIDEMKPGFYERYASLAEPGQRPGIARNPEELFPANPNLARTKSNFKALGKGSGWFIDLNQSSGNMVNRIRQACEVAGLRFGKDVRI